MAEFKVPSLPSNLPTADEQEKRSKTETEIETKEQESTSPDFNNDKETKKRDKTITNTPPSVTLSSTTEQQKQDIPYTEPSWSGPPPSSALYKLSVIKKGVEIDTIDLSNKPFLTFGRLPVCDVHLEHPSISRYHAVLQYRPTPSDRISESTLISNNPKDVGFYLYELGSVHGTRLNKTKIESRCYYRVRVGQTMSFGGSSRLFILDQSGDSIQEIIEEEAEKEREEILQKREEYNQLVAEAQAEEERMKQMKEALGATWGLLTEDDLVDRRETIEIDPEREAYYMEDPKKALKKFFDREGLELEYETEESDTPSGKMYTVRVLLPIEDITGEPMYAEGSQENKKKDAVVKCALEACRLLDAEDVLRNPMKNYKRKKRNWEENDYYDSDEDNFLDRTGDIDRKRKTRMKREGKVKETVETYESLMAKLTEVEKEITKIHSALNMSAENNSSGSGDTLDSYMRNIGSQLDKRKESEMKLKLHQLKKEETYLKRLVKAVEPCKLPTSASHVNDDEKKVESYQQKSITIDPPPTTTTTTTTCTSERIPSVKENESQVSSSLSSPPRKSVVSLKEKRTISFNNKTTIIGPSLPKINEKNDNKSNKEMIEEFDEDYESWLPPDNQTGDGKTSLNEKFGY